MGKYLDCNQAEKPHTMHNKNSKTLVSQSIGCMLISCLIGIFKITASQLITKLILFSQLFT